MIRSSLHRILPTVLSLAIAPLSAMAEWTDPWKAPSEPMPEAKRGLLLDAVELVRGRIVAVGERGHVLISDDGGESWRQATVPTRSTLTAVAAADATVVAVGHDGIILHSIDAGETWRRVREEPYAPDNAASPSNGSPLLDVQFLDSGRALAVGAYSLMLASADGGASWAPISMSLAENGGSQAPVEGASRDDDPASSIDGGDVSDPLLFSEDELMLDDEIDPHLNAIVRIGSSGLLLVGERGTLFRSDDDGITWRRLDLPYGGSMFGGLALGGDRVLIFGLRGRAFESADAGDSWRELDTGTQATLFGGDIADDGTVVLVGAQGTMVRRGNGDDAFQTSIYVTDAGETPTSSAILMRSQDERLLFGDRGVFVRKQP